MSLRDKVATAIYGVHNPYAGFNPTSHAGIWYNDPGAARETIDKAIAATQAHFIIEVGSFVGESAIHMADVIAQRVDPCILCIDTWLGGFDHWTKAYEKLLFINGRPSLYEQFLSNVINRGKQNIIVPLVLDSMNGARLCKHLGFSPDLVYVDASHEEGDVIRDYEAYWDILRPGGGLLVDDLTGWFPGVLHDWAEFVDKHNLSVEWVEGEKGLILKP